MKKSIPQKVEAAESQIKDFFDLAAPGVIKFNPDYYVLGDTFRCVWAIREYPPITSDQAILSRLNAFLDSELEQRATRSQL